MLKLTVLSFRVVKMVEYIYGICVRFEDRRTKLIACFITFSSISSSDLYKYIYERFKMPEVAISFCANDTCQNVIN